MIEPIGMQTSVAAGQSAVTLGTGATGVTSRSDGGFAEALGQVAATTVSSVRQAEAMSIAGLRGEADLRQTIEAVLAAERSLQTMIAVRDKLVGAYTELSRMQI